MVYSREVYFEDYPPSIEKIIERVGQRTGIRATYLADKWLLTNPVNIADIFCLYPDEANTITLINEGAETDLLKATLDTLFEMGGHYSD
ncbi:hypothetical protein GO730_06850 [Spirosoma sp. HMF3257]|uniref:Uncharacterized protein n=1 Tax=Spirosoma telluris TaxID=2183553 RepID=A0A327NFU2_9BACT|nr:hypothetical protein [Spirosoma telluris]RAI74122.1 hypothetical protein HMF3257_06780 [Spirosoma telluris]